MKYHKRILYPTMIEVAVRVSEIGRTSLMMEYEGTSEIGDLLISGSTLLVMFDYQEELPVRVPEDVKLAIVNWENA